jgi:hypothetical protein
LSTKQDDNEYGRNVQHVLTDHATIKLQEEKMLVVEVQRATSPNNRQQTRSSQANKKFLSKYGLGEAKIFSP